MTLLAITKVKKFLAHSWQQQCSQFGILTTCKCEEMTRVQNEICLMIILLRKNLLYRHHAGAELAFSPGGFSFIFGCHARWGWDDDYDDDDDDDDDGYADDDL